MRQCSRQRSQSARQSGGHLVFLHVRIDVQPVLMAMATADMGGGCPRRMKTPQKCRLKIPQVG